MKHRAASNGGGPALQCLLTAMRKQRAPELLPSPNTQHWTVRRKAAVINGVRSGLLTSVICYRLKNSVPGNASLTSTARPGCKPRECSFTEQRRNARHREDGHDD